MRPKALTPDVRLARGRDIVQAALSTESIVLMKVGGDHYYSLEGCGTRIWEILENEQSIRSLCDTLAAEFDVSADVCLQDTLELLDSLIDEDLVIVMDG